MKSTSPRTSDPSPFWGLFSAAIAGAALGYFSQLYYLSYVSFDNPAWRLCLGPIGGAVGGMLIAIAAAFLIAKITRLPVGSAGKLAGWALLAASALLAPFWYALSSADAYWLVPALWAVAMATLYPLVRPHREPTGAKRLEKIIPLLVGAVVIGGLLLRLSGVNYGLPGMIAHCDTPKQLQLLHYFMQGNLMPPSTYPVGHIYIYAGLIQLYWALAPLTGQAPLLMLGTVPDSANLVLAARSIGACLGAAIPLIGFFVAKRLWGTWTGLAAALLLAIDPMHLTYSRQAMGEIPQTFWVMLSLFFSVRLLQEKRWWDCLLAGLFAGLAAATKIYGGYILAAGFAAWLLSAPRRVWIPMVLLAATALGAFIGTPYAWFDFSAWIHNLSVMSSEQYDAGSWFSIWPGLQYSFVGLIHRFQLPWLLAAIAGLVLLAKCRRKEDLLFLVPTVLSLIFIYSLRLRYLREWDFVNLTVYLNLAVAALLAPLANWATRHKVWGKLAPIGIGLFLIMQTWTAVSDAWVARVEDNRGSAACWLASLTRPGERIKTEMGLSGAYTDWCVVEGPGMQANGIGAELRKGLVPSQADALVIEEAWSAPDLPLNPLKPLLDLQVRHTYWEHPRVAIYRPDSPGYNGKVALPLFRAARKRYAFWNTEFSRSLPAELEDKPGWRRQVAFAQKQSIGRVGYLALGQGRGRLSLGPGLSIALEIRQNQPASGMAYLLRSPVPLLPRTYQVGLDWPEENLAWVGVFPQPQGMLPMLIRLGDWPKVEQVAREVWRQGHCPEAGLILATALARRGQKESASQMLNELNGYHPKFLQKYKSLGSKPRSGILTGLSDMTGLGPAVLTWRRVVWPEENGWWGEQCQEGNDPAQQEKSARKHHLWLTQEFLPGFIRLRATIDRAKTGPAGKSVLKLVAHRPGILVAEIAKAQLEPGQSQVEITGRVASGPVRLEVVLESETPDQPRLRRVELEPDLSAEFAWRWQVFQEQLGRLVD